MKIYRTFLAEILYFFDGENCIDFVTVIYLQILKYLSFGSPGKKLENFLSETPGVFVINYTRKRENDRQFRRNDASSRTSIEEN